MALTKAGQAVQASTSNSAGGTTTSSWFAIGYGASIVATVTNGGTGPTVGCSVVVEVSSDGGTTAVEFARYLAPTTSSTTYRFRPVLAQGTGAEWGHYRVKFTGNTGQAVTVQADASSVTATI